MKTIFREEAIDTPVMACNISLWLLILLTVGGGRQGFKVPVPARFSLALASRLLWLQNITRTIMLWNFSIFLPLPATLGKPFPAFSFPSQFSFLQGAAPLSFPLSPHPPYNGPYLQTGCGYSRVRLISKVRMSVIENGIKDLRLHERFLIISFSPFTFRWYKYIKGASVSSLWPSNL